MPISCFLLVLFIGRLLQIRDNVWYSLTPWFRYRNIWKIQDISWGSLLRSNLHGKLNTAQPNSHLKSCFPFLRKNNSLLEQVDQVLIDNRLHWRCKKVRFWWQSRDVVDTNVEQKRMLATNSSHQHLLPFKSVPNKVGPVSWYWSEGLTVPIISMQSRSFFDLHLLYCQWILLIIVDIPKDQTWFGFMAEFFPQNHGNVPHCFWSFRIDYYSQYLLVV